MIDTHAHLDFKQFDADRDKVIKKCFNKGITKIINISNKFLDFDNIYFAIGYHPYDIDKFNLEKLEKLAKHKKVVAIGECGLDKNGKEQEKIFLQQMQLAQELDLPLIIHCRGNHERMLEILKGRGVVHCFTGTLKQAQKYLNLGFYLSFTGLITYDRSYDRVIKQTPLERLLLETDCPFLAPVPYRGERCEPWMVKFIAKQIAKIKNISFNKVIRQTTKNVEKLFKI